MQTALELYHLANQGTRFDGWSRTEIERAKKYAMGNHRLMPEALIWAGDAFAKRGLLRLPSKEVLLDFDTADQKFQRLALLCWRIHNPVSDMAEAIAVSPFVRVGDRWSGSMLTILFAHSGQVQRAHAPHFNSPAGKEFIKYLDSMAYALTIGALSLFKLGNASLQFIAPESHAHHEKRFPFYQVAIARTDH